MSFRLFRSRSGFKGTRAWHLILFESPDSASRLHLSLGIHNVQRIMDIDCHINDLNRPNADLICPQLSVLILSHVERRPPRTTPSYPYSDIAPPNATLFVHECGTAVVGGLTVLNPTSVVNLR